MPQPPNSQTLTPNPKAVDHNRRPVRRRLAVSRPAHQPPEFEEIIGEEKVNAGDLLLFFDLLLLPLFLFLSFDSSPASSYSPNRDGSWAKPKSRVLSV
jgi:hypothetical protein